jgi:hypothetical protein
MLAAAGCADREEASTEPAPAEVATAGANRMADGKAEASGEPIADVEPIQRKLIQNAELHVRVSSYAAARDQIEKDLSEMGGFIADATVEHSDGTVSVANLTIRVPSEKLNDFLAGTAGHGDVLHEKLTSEDITEGYYDAKARLANAKRLEARLLTLLDDKADSVTALLEVERELARVRGQIEQIEGKLRLWDKQVALSTVRLRLVTEQTYAVTTPPTIGERLKETLGGSYAALRSFGLGLLVTLVALVPWLIPLAIVGLALRALVRRLRRNRSRAAMPTVVTPNSGSAV